MQIYKAPINDMRFLLEAFDYENRVAGLKPYEDYDLETAVALLEEGGKFCTNEMLPLNRSGDQQGLKWDPETGAVTTPDGFKALHEHFVKSGTGGIAMPAEYGGGGAPATIAFMLSEMATATNKSYSMCPGLTHGLVEALVHYGTDEQKQNYLPKLITSEWAGTMCLTEPQCGTDLGLISTRAIPDGDAFKLTGTKIWITFGEHDLTENIIHLVLARLPDAPAGIKGISAFIVPKFTLDGVRNGINCTGLEHKMGINASPTCVMSMEDATGYLVGEPHKGMRTMFVMMNNARLSVGLEGVALSEISYQTALAFAKDRRQMRALDPAKREKGKKADNIMVHPDVRRMLMNIKTTQEGMRSLAIWAAINLDVSHHSEDEKTKQRAKNVVALLTPVVKSYLTERGFANISEAMQVTGGAGYTTDWSIEQYMRDSRIALIYEGTNHIQALDLVGRKLPKGGGALYKSLLGQINFELNAMAEDEELAEFIEPTRNALEILTEQTMALGMKGMQDPEEAGAVASNYLNVFALAAMAFTWTKQVKSAKGRKGRFYETKIKTARYYFSNILPEIHSLVAIIPAGKANMMALDVDDF